MEQRSIQGFIDDAMSRLAKVRSELGSLQAGRNSIPATSLAQILDTVQGGASELGLNEIASSAKEAIGALFTAVDGPVSPALVCLSQLETLLLRKSLEDDYLNLDLDVSSSDTPFVDVDEVPQFEFSVTEPADSTLASLWNESNTSEADGPDDFEVDDELLEIFAGEAEELLQNIENSLRSLEADPNNKDALWEIRRNAHTFKGSAGIVGLKQISELAHRVEDLLDRLAETSADSNPGILNFLRSSFDCLKALTAGENTPALFHRISQLYYDFDGILAGLEIREEPANVEIPPTFSASETLFELVEHTPEIAELPAGEHIVSKADEAKPNQKSSRSVVRVSLERLDELVGIVRGLIIGRSAFEQRLKDLEHQIEELHNTTRRLQSTSTKLEIDFEASMLNSERSRSFGSSYANELNSGAVPGGFDELEFDKYTDFHQNSRELAEVTGDTFAINTALDILRGNFETLFEGQRLLTDDLHEKLMRIRMVDFGSLATRLQRAVRVTCEEENKKAEVVIENEAVDIDTQILDTLIEPLMHLLKNAVVHGIETPSSRQACGKPESGTIRVKVANEDTHIVVTVSDDGRGIVPSAIREKAVALGLVDYETAQNISDEKALGMIFLPGLSTAERLNLSAGRGVGMSIVKESIEASRGTITMRSEPGFGTTFIIRMPLPLAVTKVLVVETGLHASALPLKHVRRVLEADAIDTSDMIESEGERTPLVYLSDHLGELTPVQADAGLAVITKSSERDLGLLVDRVRGSEEVVIKPLGSPLDKLDCVLGASVLGNGELVPILDAANLEKSRRLTIAEASPEPAAVTVLIVDDSPSVRHLTSKVISGAGWIPLTAKDGLDALEKLKSASSPPVVILSDIEMPRMDGFEFAASLKRSEEFNGIPLIMITSRAADKHRNKAMEAGVAKYLTKPYNDSDLLNSIRELANLT